jgi:hypothetical protein
LNGRRTSFVKTYVEILFSISKQIFVLLLLSASVCRRVITDEVDEVLEIPVTLFVSSLRPVDYRKKLFYISVTG